MRLNLMRCGAGEPLVLVHGIGHRWQAWTPVLDRLAAHHDVIAIDLPGFGESPVPPGGMPRGMAATVAMMAEYFAAEGLDRPHVAGLSFGGALALEFCRRHTDMPRSLILASAYAGWAGSLPADVADARLGQALRLADLSPEEFVDTLLPTMFSEVTPQESIDIMLTLDAIRKSTASGRWEDVGP